MTLKCIWRSFSLGCHFHVHFSYPWHAFTSHGLSWASCYNCVYGFLKAATLPFPVRNVIGPLQTHHAGQACLNEPFFLQHSSCLLKQRMNAAAAMRVVYRTVLCSPSSPFVCGFSSYSIVCTLCLVCKHKNLEIYYMYFVLMYMILLLWFYSVTAGAYLEMWKWKGVYCRSVHIQHNSKVLEHCILDRYGSSFETCDW